MCEIGGTCFIPVVFYFQSSGYHRFVEDTPQNEKMTSVFPFRMTSVFPFGMVPHDAFDIEKYKEYSHPALMSLPRSRMKLSMCVVDIACALIYTAPTYRSYLYIRRSYHTYL